MSQAKSDSAENGKDKAQDNSDNSGALAELEKLRLEYRDKIDELDERILRDLNERAKCAIEVGLVKKQHGQRLFDPEREAKVLRRLVEINKGPLANEAVLRLFERIIDESRKVERTQAYDK